MPPSRRMLPHRPRTVRGWLITAIAATTAVVAAGLAFAYFAVFATSSPAPLTLSPLPSTSAAAAQTSVATTNLAGAWTVTSGSVAGYRVREQLAFLTSPTDAVGRTSSITGTATVTDSGGSLTVTATSFTVDVSTLASDRSMRDQRIHSIGLESDRYPTASFVLTSPIELPASASTGQQFHVSAVGRLTIHGTTKTETIPLDAQLSGAQIQIAGSITFPWSDFGMQTPSVGGFVTVTDQATMEFRLNLRRA